MNVSFEAIYQDGVLKPLHPTQLREGERVRVSIQPSNGVDDTAPGPFLEDQTSVAPFDLFDLSRSFGQPLSIHRVTDLLPDGIGLAEDVPTT